MPDDAKLPKQPPCRQAEATDYEVGYGKPPTATQFRPGQSGNPRGRPKGAKTNKKKISARNEARFNKVLLEECYREIGVRDGDKLIQMPVIQAVIRNQALNAAKGNQRSQRMLTDSLKSVEQGAKAQHDEYVKTMIEYKVHFEKVLAYRKEHGIEGERPYPHPDDIHINMATGDVEILGPMTPDEDDYVKVVRLKFSTDSKIIDAEYDLADHPKSRAKKERLANLRSLMSKINADLETHPGRGRFEHIDLSALAKEFMDP
jgi:hypothetical protein